MLHGCRQLVLWNVGLISLTSETLTLCYLLLFSFHIENVIPIPVPYREGEGEKKCKTLRVLPVRDWRKVRMTSSPHDPYGLGYTRVTMSSTKSSNDENRSKSQKTRPSSDCSLQFENMKPESLVIVDQHATVNLYLSLVLPARHTLRIRCIGSLFDTLWADLHWM